MNKIMRIVCILILILLSVDFKAQSSYHKMLGDTNRWFVTGTLFVVKAIPSSTNGIGSPCMAYYIANHDSIYQTKKYKVFQLEPSGYCSYNSISTHALNNILIREDTISKKIFLVHPDSVNESICIDFSMNIGDSIYLPFQPNSYALKKGYYKLDSIVLKPEIQGNRKHFYLNNRFSTLNNGTKKYYIEWIESIGAVHFPINLVDADGTNPFYNFCNTLQYSSAVTCKFSNNIKQYQDSCILKSTATLPLNNVIHEDDCKIMYVLGGGINEININTIIKISPNPFINELILEFNEKINSNVELSLMDMYGNTAITKQVNQTEISSKTIINTTVLNKGIYLLKVKTGNATAGYKLIKAE